MERINYLPLGSIVHLAGSTQKLMIVSRGLRVRNGDEIVFFDYGATIYPIGIANDQMVYFQHDAISDVVFEGFKDSDEEAAVNNINSYLEKNPDTIRGSVETWKE